MGAGIIRTGNLFIGNIFRPETSCYNNNENAWDRLPLHPTITSWRKRGKSWTKQWLQTSSVLLPHPLPKNPGGCCYQRQCTWQQEDGHHCLLTRLQSCWVVMIRDHKLTWEKDIIFTRSISTSILKIWISNPKFRGQIQLKYSLPLELANTTHTAGTRHVSHLCTNAIGSSTGRRDKGPQRS